MDLADLMVLIFTDVEADDVCSTQESGRAGRVHQVFPVSVQVKGPKAPPQPVTSPSGALQQAVFAHNSKPCRNVECDYLTALTVADFKNLKDREFADLLPFLKTAQFTLRPSTKSPLLACRSEVSNIGEPGRY